MASLALAGCDRDRPATAETRTPAGLATRYFPPAGWGWGEVVVPGAPPLRYGVAAPAGEAAQGQVLILPGQGEPVEAWFETANALVDRGYLVWAIDWAGQGGSGRWSRTADRLYVPSVDLDVAALRRLVAEVVRPAGHAPLVLVGDGFGAQVGLRALSGGLTGVAGAVLTHPALVAGDSRTADWFSKAGFARQSAFGERPWANDRTRPKSRAEVARAWMQENPALRSLGESWGWTAAADRSAALAGAAATLRAVKAPVAMLGDETREPAARAACARLPDCRWRSLAGPAPHLADDTVRDAWLKALDGFMAERTRGYAVASPPTAPP